MLADIVDILDAGRRASARAVNSVMTATYWAVGRRIVEREQHGRKRAVYGEELIERLSHDLVARFGRGFGRSNLFQMRAFYQAYRDILQIPSGQSPGPKVQTASGKSVRALSTAGVAPHFPLPWSHYVRLMALPNPEARSFYQAEVLRGGWTVRQLDRQMGSQFYERTLLSKNKAAMLARGAVSRPEDVVSAEQEIGVGSKGIVTAWPLQ